MDRILLRLLPVKEPERIVHFNVPNLDLSQVNTEIVTGNYWNILVLRL